MSLNILAGRIGITNRIVDGGVGWGGNDANNKSLILLWSQFLRRQHRDQEKHDRGKKRDAAPDDVDRRPRVECAIEMLPIPVTKTIKRPVNESAKPGVDMVGPEQVGAHHGRQDQGNNAGNKDGAGQREGKLAEQKHRSIRLEERWACKRRRE